MNESDVKPKTLCVVWLDRAHAKVKLHPNGLFESWIVRWGTPDPLRTAEDPSLLQSVRLFLEVSDVVGEAQSILLIGPGMAKYHLRSFWLEQRPRLGRSIVGFETLEHFDEGQLAARALHYLA